MVIDKKSGKCIIGNHRLDGSKIPFQCLKNIIDLQFEIRMIVDKKVQVIGVSMMKISPAESGATR